MEKSCSDGGLSECRDECVNGQPHSLESPLSVWGSSAINAGLSLEKTHCGKETSQACGISVAVKIEQDGTESSVSYGGRPSVYCESHCHPQESPAMEELRSV